MSSNKTKAQLLDELTNLKEQIVFGEITLDNEPYVAYKIRKSTLENPTGPVAITGYQLMPRVDLLTELSGRCQQAQVLQDENAIVHADNVSLLDKVAKLEKLNVTLRYIIGTTVIIYGVLWLLCVPHLTL